MNDAFGEEKAKVRYLLIDGQKIELNKPGPKDQKKQDEDEDEEKAKDKPEREDKKEEDAPDPVTEKPAPVEEKPDAPPGDRPEVVARPEQPSEGEDEPDRDPSKIQAKAISDNPETLEDQPPTTPFVDIATEFDEDRRPTLQTGGNVLIQDATILTVGPDGTIPRGSILVRNGKIAAVGPDVKAPEGFTVIDAKGLVAMPGIIDTHSHMAIQGGVNEMSLSIVPEVRVRDVVDGRRPDDLPRPGRRHDHGAGSCTGRPTRSAGRTW